ncbi:putative reverse transcriptase domain-containing protein [Tanacetum coccineum]|uniref:Reverse transcriptase domain-containing protein n=1 Tax=Tanacetum coccineum TaxID=301880 RepID=A0ABQ4ZHB9_9ASTR
MDPYVGARLQALPSPDYVPSHEEPEQAPPSPDYVPGPEHADDESVAEDKPDAKDASPTTQLPDYVLESDPEADPEEDDDEDPSVRDPGPFIPADGEDDGDDKEGSLEDDEDDDIDMEADKDEEEEEHTRRLPDFSLYLLHHHHRSPHGLHSPLPTDIQLHPKKLTTITTLIRRTNPRLPYHRQPRDVGIALGPRYEVGESSSAAAARPAGGLRADYGFVATMDREIRRDPERETDKQSQRQLFAGPAHKVVLETDEHMHIHVIRWRQRLDFPERLGGDRWMRVILPARDHRRSAEMRELRTADRTRQQQLIQTLTVIQSLQGQVTILHGKVTALQGQQGPVGGPAQPKKLHQTTTRSTPVTTTPAPTATTTTLVTNAQLQAMINQGVTAALAARDANNNGDDSHTSGTSGRRTKRIVRECAQQGGIPMNEMKKLEAELWNLKVKGTDVIGYNQRFQELALLCVRMFPEESDKIERKSSPFAKRQAENKRKFENTSRNNQNQQQQNKRQNTGRAYTAGTGEKKPYGGSKPLCAKCNYHHDGALGQGQILLAFECRGSRSYFKWECQTKEQQKTVENQDVMTGAPSQSVKFSGHAGTNPDSNIVTGTFLLNNRYASILFDTGADRSFVSTAFSSQMDITPSTLDHYYDVELADGRIIGLNTILRGCTLNLLNHPFNINLMPVELGSFDAIIGMDWLAKYQAIIVCAEKIVRIPWGNETLIVHGDGSNQGHEARLHIISYSKTQEYMLKGCPVFLAHVTTKLLNTSRRRSDLRMYQ